MFKIIIKSQQPISISKLQIISIRAKAYITMKMTKQKRKLQDCLGCHSERGVLLLEIIL